MCGSLLAMAPRGVFSGETVWATVADSEKDGKKIKIFAELCKQLNGESDSAAVAVLLSHSGGITIAESPSFYRAYAPAIRVLQARPQPLWTNPCSCTKICQV